MPGAASPAQRLKPTTLAQSQIQDATKTTSNHVGPLRGLWNHGKDLAARIALFAAPFWVSLHVGKVGFTSNDIVTPLLHTITNLPCDSSGTLASINIGGMSTLNIELFSTSILNSSLLFLPGVIGMGATNFVADKIFQHEFPSMTRDTRFLGTLCTTIFATTIFSRFFFFGVEPTNPLTASIFLRIFSIQIATVLLGSTCEKVVRTIRQKWKEKQQTNDIKQLNEIKHQLLDLKTQLQQENQRHGDAIEQFNPQVKAATKQVADLEKQIIDENPRHKKAIEQLNEALRDADYEFLITAHNTDLEKENQLHKTAVQSLNQQSEANTKQVADLEKQIIDENLRHKKAIEQLKKWCGEAEKKSAQIQARLKLDPHQKAD